MENTFFYNFMWNTLIFEWNRYVEGDILYDVTDEKSANTVHSYVLDPENNLSLEDTHKYFDYIMKVSG